MSDEDHVNQDVWVRSLYGAKNKCGLVSLTFGGDKAHMFTPQEARRIGRLLIECAEAADTDELVMDWLKERMHIDDERMKATVLDDFRKMRTEKYGDLI